MKIYVSNREIEQIAEGLVGAAFGQPPPRCIDIAGIAEYLGITVRYERIAETDLDKIGFAADGRTPLKVFRDGSAQPIIFPKDTVVLEEFLKRPEELCRRRFVAAHEISHILIRRANPRLPIASGFNRVYDTERSYTTAELRERMNIEECQANAMAAVILMPRAVLSDALHRHMQMEKIPVYGGCVFLPEMKPAIQEMANELCVSYTAMLIQLRKYDLLEPRSMEEYFQRTKMSGGMKW